jgi:Sec-independent protein translocase protein TatA
VTIGSLLVGGFGLEKFTVVLVVALMVLGPDKFPSALRTIGKMMGEIRHLTEGFQDEVRGVMSAPAAEPMAGRGEAEVAGVTAADPEDVPPPPD